MKRIKGFTLIELIVVVAIVGVIIAIIAPSTNGKTDTVEAQKIRKSMTDMMRNWRMITTACSLPMNNVLIEGDRDWEGVVLEGRINSAYAECYKNSGATPLREVASWDEDYGGYLKGKINITLGPIISADQKTLVVGLWDEVPKKLALDIVKIRENVSSITCDGNVQNNHYVCTEVSPGSDVLDMFKLIEK